VGILEKLLLEMMSKARKIIVYDGYVFFGRVNAKYWII
jgi:hypothetical protein